LSAPYETILSSRAATLVARFARECIKQREANGNQKPHALKSDDYPRLPDIHVVSSSEGSENDAESGDDAVARPSPIPISRPRKYSSSPATSFSTDQDIRDTASKEAGLSTQRVIKGKTPARDQPVLISDRRSSSRMPKPERSRGASSSAQQIQAQHVPVVRKPPANYNSSEGVTRPYLCVNERERRARKLRNLYHHSNQPITLGSDHFDFIREEVEQLCLAMKPAFIGYQRSSPTEPVRQLSAFMSGKSKAEVARFSTLIHEKVHSPGPELGCKLLHHRGADAIASFLSDAAESKLINPKACATRASMSTYALARHLRGREISGIAPLPAQRGRSPLRIQALSSLEDSLARQVEWTDCCGDIATITWTSNNGFICGATAHSDHYNMQYNKPGNLTVGCLSQNELKAVPDHRIPRPLVAMAENRENASHAMRETQDPWLYTSVVSTSFSETSGLSFTASFDKTVKAWKVPDDGSSMLLLGIWRHDNKVNFVVASQNHDRVATAADVSDNAIRVYKLDGNDLSHSPYDTYSGERAREQASDIARIESYADERAAEQAGELERLKNWAYFPATIAWGRCYSTRNLLLVGYSPRSITNDDLDIPEERRNTGELCLWDVEDYGRRIAVPSARSQNVFEVLWHPSQPCFIAATSPGGMYDSTTRTQIRVFAQSPDTDYHYIQTKTLDCSASDINELTIMPNSLISSFVTASCTDGNTYVYDTAQGDKATHVLNHGDSLDNPSPDVSKEIGDQGVKFASWGQSSDRFYTGSTDGKVKAWDVRAPVGKAFVRNVLEVSGGISAGSFSKDFSKLLVGDATGKVHLLCYDDSDLVLEAESPAFSELNVGHSVRTTNMKRPIPIIQYNEAADIEEETGLELSRKFIEEGQLVTHLDPRVGVVQGPNYAHSNFFDLESHEEFNAALPLRQEILAKQQFVALLPRENLSVDWFLDISSSSPNRHMQNVLREEELERVGMELEWEYYFKKEQTPRFSKLFRERNSSVK
jgi:WD40 repeat protein